VYTAIATCTLRHYVGVYTADGLAKPNHDPGPIVITIRPDYKPYGVLTR